MTFFKKFRLTLDKLDLFLDPIVGLLLVFVIWAFFDVELTVWLILAGVFFPLLPDIDFFIELFLRGSVGGKRRREHRTFLHWPLLFLVVSCLLYFWHPAYAVLLFLGSAWHLIHDSYTGWGIPLLAPFTWRSFKLHHQGKWLVSWSWQELQEKMAQEGDPNWMAEYFGFNRKNMIAFLVFGVFFAVLLFFSLSL